MSKMSLLGKIGPTVFGFGKEALKAAPVASAGLIAGTAEPVVEGGIDFLRGLDLGGGQAEATDRQRRAREDFQDMVAQRDRAMRRMRAEMLARVAGADPQLYSQVSAGRKLPDGAVVIGGAPRVDLMQQLADAMMAG